MRKWAQFAVELLNIIEKEAGFSAHAERFELIRSAKIDFEMSEPGKKKSPPPG